MGVSAQRLLNSGRLDAAERIYREILAMLQAQPTSPQQQWRLAVGYHQLAMVAQDRGRLDEAADWFARALAIFEKLGDRPGLALIYSQLGLLAEVQHSPGRALDGPVRGAVRRRAASGIGDRPRSAGSANPPAWDAGSGGLLAAGHRWLAARCRARLRPLLRPDTGDTPEGADQ